MRESQLITAVNALCSRLDAFPLGQARSMLETGLRKECGGNTAKETDRNVQEVIQYAIKHGRVHVHMDGIELLRKGPGK